MDPVIKLEDEELKIDVKHEPLSGQEIKYEFPAGEEIKYESPAGEEIKYESPPGEEIAKVGLDNQLQASPRVVQPCK